MFDCSSLKSCFQTLVPASRAFIAGALLMALRRSMRPAGSDDAFRQLAAISVRWRRSGSN